MGIKAFENIAAAEIKRVKATPRSIYLCETPKTDSNIYWDLSVKVLPGVKEKITKILESGGFIIVSDL